MLPLSEKELDEMVALERSRGIPSLTDWDSLAARLRAEGLMKSPPTTARLLSSRWMQAAAGLLLAMGGAAAGRVSAGASALPVRDVQTTAQTAAAAPQAETGVTPAAATPDFSSPEQAWEILNRAGEQYQRASAYLSASNTEVPLPPEPEQYRTRLAALDNVMSEMRDALKEAPQDPVINQYYLATVGAREATLRQMGTALPASARLNRF